LRKKILQRNEERKKKYPAEHLGGKKFPAHQVARKKNLADQKSPTSPSRVKWSAPKLTVEPVGK